MEEHVDRRARVPHAEDIQGHRMKFNGKISFDWKVRDGRRTHSAEFLVAYTNIDLIFGRSYIREKQILIPNWSPKVPLVAPLLAHKQEPLSEQANRALLKEQQRREQARLNTAHVSQSQMHQTSGTGSSDWKWSEEHQRPYRTLWNARRSEWDYIWG